MSMADTMQVYLRLPSGVLFDGPALALRAQSATGSFGILPNHVDYVAQLVPSILLITDADGHERIFGIDEGLLVKKGRKVELAVRRAQAGDDLETLQGSISDSFAGLEDEERAARAALSRLEADMVRRFATLRKGQA